MNRRQLIVRSSAAAAAMVTAYSAAPSRASPPPGFRGGTVETLRHRTAYIESGPATGPLMIFLHGFPELGIVWKAQMAHFAKAGWRCVAPDMRGYGGSSAPATVAAYTVREIASTDGWPSCRP